MYTCTHDIFIYVHINKYININVQIHGIYKDHGYHVQGMRKGALHIMSHWMVQSTHFLIDLHEYKKEVL